MNRYLLLDTPAGRMGIAGNEEALTHLFFGERAPAGLQQGETALLRSGREQLAAYFAGERREFDLPLAPAGTPFQRAVWDALREIPYGDTRTYGQVAAAIGKPKAVRAVGGASNRNPIAILVPCHRVVGANGSLTGYAAGLDMKRFLLRLEMGGCGVALR